jgi:threonyl-tRNA synthetase
MPIITRIRTPYNHFINTIHVIYITLTLQDFPELDKHVTAQCKQKQTFDRLLLSKEEALEMFKYNPFKTEYITTRIPDGGCTTVYKVTPITIMRIYIL